MGFELNSQQAEAVRLGQKWWKSGTSQVFEISGPAGSGKTTIIKTLTEMLGLDKEDVLFMAYVGKAAMVLARQGNLAQTIHSSIYDLTDVPKVDDEGNFIMKNGRIETRMGFVKKHSLPSNIKLIVIDEGSMVNKEIAEDVLSFGIPVIVLGDLNQLPPVIGSPYFLIQPDVVLTQIMRQAEGNPIIHLSQKAIKGEYIDFGKYGDMCYVIEKDEVTNNLMKSSDIIICGKNATRDDINRYYRKEILGIDKPFPVRGDKIVCRQNNWKEKIDGNIFLINGLIGYVEHVYPETFKKKTIDIDFKPEFTDNYFEKLTIDFPYLFEKWENKDNKRSYYNRFEFAHAITCHISQGSQFNKVLLYNERFGDRQTYNKWLYTGITRAVNGLVLAK